MSPLYFCLIFVCLPRTIRSIRSKNSCMRSASVDLGGTSLHFINFSSVLRIPSENIGFQHLETRKNQLFRTSSIFLRRGSSRTFAKLTKACKICIWARTVQFSTKLRGTRPFPKFSTIGIQIGDSDPSSNPTDDASHLDGGLKSQKFIQFITFAHYTKVLSTCFVHFQGF